jgi:hypothetical protein
MSSLVAVHAIASRRPGLASVEMIGSDNFSPCLLAHPEHDTTQQDHDQHHTELACPITVGPRVAPGGNDEDKMTQAVYQILSRGTHDTPSRLVAPPGGAKGGSDNFNRCLLRSPLTGGTRNIAACQTGLSFALGFCVFPCLFCRVAWVMGMRGS